MPKSLDQLQGTINRMEELQEPVVRVEQVGEWFIPLVKLNKTFILITIIPSLQQHLEVPQRVGVTMCRVKQRRHNTIKVLHTDQE